MALHIGPVQSKALIPYTPPADRYAQLRALADKTGDAYLNSASSQSPPPATIRDRILKGTYENLTFGAERPPKPFNGTCEDLLSVVTKTVHKTVDELDYNGAQPFLKILDQIDQKGNFGEVRIDSRNEQYGSTCIGSSHAILQNLKDQHQIDGMLAVQRQSSAHPLEHGAVIVECSDGFVLLDARADPTSRIFSIPFGGTEQYRGFSITASQAGSNVPLIVKYPTQQFEYLVNVTNGDDLVMKHFVMEAPFAPKHEYFPIATYNSDGSDRKFIGVSLKTSSLFLKDRQAPPGTIAETIPFTFIQNRPQDFFQKLQAFMEPNESFSGFHTPTQVAFQQLTRLAAPSQQARIQRLFTETNPAANF